MLNLLVHLPQISFMLPEMTVVPVTILFKGGDWGFIEIQVVLRTSCMTALVDAQCLVSI